MTASDVDHFLEKASLIGPALYQEFAPAPDIRPFVACTWVRVGRQDGRETSNAILPDGCADIMVWGDQAPTIAGPDAVTRWAARRDEFVIIGIRLRPGACRAVLHCPAERIVNGALLLSDLTPRAAGLHHALMAAGHLAARIALLEDWVRAAIGRASDTDRAVIAACTMLSGALVGDVSAIARRFDWSPRMIHRHFVAACGYGPKHFHRIMRVQDALRAAHDGTSTNLGAVAAAAGYADQAHTTRDFRAITSFTPARYFADHADPGWGAWLAEGW